MPAAGDRLAIGRQPFAPPQRTPRACRLRRKTPDLSPFELGRRGRRWVLGLANPLVRREHHGPEDRRRTSDTARILQLASIEVANPNPHRKPRREANRPVVVVGLRGAGLHGDRKWELQAAAPPE